MDTQHTEPTDQASRILMVIFEFTPWASAQVIRWANLLHYMAECGRQITVVTAQFAEGDMPQDPALTAIVEHPNITIERVPIANFNPGYPAIIRWARAAYRHCVDRIQQRPYNVVLTSALPIHAHIVGSALKRAGHVPLWVADYGDPWSTSRTLDQGPLKKAVEQVIEREMIRPADALLVTTPGAKDAFTPIYNKHDRIYTVPMGASYFHLQTDWSAPSRTLPADEPLQILYPGKFYRSREPDVIFEGFARVEDVHLTVIGKHEIDIEAAAKQHGLTEITSYPHGSQQKIVQMQQEADVLLLSSWPVPEQISGKFYEYLATNKPILYISHHEDDLAMRILREKDIAYICHHDADSIEKTLLTVRDDARSGRLKNHQPVDDVGFDARARQLLTILESLMG